MTNLIKVLYYLQQNDGNGNYMDILDEIEADTLTITDAKLECIAILQRWLTENVEENDIVTRYKINELINIIK